MNFRQAIPVVLMTLMICLPAIADERETVTAIRNLISSGDLDEAAKAIDDARSTYPKSGTIASLGLTLAGAYARSEKLEQAQSQAIETVDFIIEMPVGQGVAVFSVLRSALSNNTLYAQRQGSVEGALALFDKAIEVYQSKPELAGDLETTKLVIMARVERGDEAKAILEPKLTAARQAHEANPDDAQTRISLAQLLAVRADMYGFLNLPPMDSLTEAVTLLSDDWILERADERTCLEAYLNTQRAFINYASRDAAVAAQERIKGLEATLAAIKEQHDDATIQESVDTTERTLSSIKRRVEATLKHEALVGQKAMPIMPESWVNGTPISPQDLQGKVVLLDFWAVWCGPCIATFPHLREWREAYADQGLVIIGATKYYSYDWDEDAGRSKKVAELAPDSERAAMEKFAKHHQLEHAFAVMDDGGELNRYYGVTGIPQVVLIDRNGRIRMIRVGSGEANATALHDMIEKLLAEN